MMMNRKLVGGVCLCLIAASLCGCGKKEAAVQKTPVVKTRVVKSLADMAAEDVFAGAVRGRFERNMSFQVGGQIIERQVQAGSRVKAGQVLMRIDPKDIVQKDIAAEAELRLARKNYERYEELYKADAVPAATRDQYRLAYEKASAAYAQTQNAMEYTELIAPADGVVASVTGEIGQVVSAGLPVLSFVNTAELEVEINVPENRLNHIAVGKSCMVSFWALDKVKAAGIIREIAPMADSTARTFKVRVALPEPPANMQLGMTASVTMNDSKKAADNLVALPVSAIYQTGNEPEVWVVSDGKAVRRKVRIEKMGADEVMVAGLKKGDTVIIAGVHKLSDNQAVRVKAEGEK